MSNNKLSLIFETAIHGTPMALSPIFGKDFSVLSAEIALGHPQLAAFVPVGEYEKMAFRAKLRNLPLDRRTALTTPHLKVGIRGETVPISSLDAIDFAEQQDRAVRESIVLGNFERDAQIRAWCSAWFLWGIIGFHAAVPINRSIMAELSNDPMMTVSNNSQTVPPRSKNSIHSPFRYVGGKFWMRNSILPLIPPHEHYLEPFCGGASIFFLQGGAACAHLNDLDGELMACYIHIRDHAEELIERLTPLTVHFDTHRYLRDEFKPADELDRAARFFYLNHTSFAGITHRKVCYWGTRSPLTARHAGWTKRICRASQRLQDVRLTNLDFEAVVDAAPDGAFLFADAPYRSARHYKYYAHVFAWEDHLRLAACLKRHSRRLRFLATYDDCIQIRDLYDWAAHVDVVHRPNRIERTDNKAVTGNVPPQRSVGRDLLIRNYAGPSHKWAILPPRESGSGSDFVALADDQWSAIEPLLPLLPRRADNRGRPWQSSREVLNGILWVLTRGVSWNRLPDNFPPYQTCHRRYARYMADGTLVAVACTLKDLGGPDLSNLPALSVQLK